MSDVAAISIYVILGLLCFIMLSIKFNVFYGWILKAPFQPISGIIILVLWPVFLLMLFIKYKNEIDDE